MIFQDLSVESYFAEIKLYQVHAPLLRLKSSGSQVGYMPLGTESKFNSEVVQIVEQEQRQLEELHKARAGLRCLLISSNTTELFSQLMLYYS